VCEDAMIYSSMNEQFDGHEKQGVQSPGKNVGDDDDEGRHDGTRVISKHRDLCGPCEPGFRSSFVRAEQPIRCGRRGGHVLWA
jgi:hypothetical protein